MSTHRVQAAAIGLLCLAIAAPAKAQSRGSAVTTDRWTVGLGLTLLREKYGTGEGGALEIQVADVRANSPLGIGFVVDGSVNRFDGFTETTVMGGIRFSLRRDARIRPFGKLLVGIERCDACKTTDPTVEPAVGIDVALGRSGRLSFRSEVGYRVTPSDRRTFHETHAIVGISVRPGRR